MSYKKRTVQIGHIIYLNMYALVSKNLQRIKIYISLYVSFRY